jgi:hypothetical protein
MEWFSELLFSFLLPLPQPKSLVSSELVRRPRNGFRPVCNAMEVRQGPVPLLGRLRRF